MSAKPHADPRKPLEERLAAAEVAIANVDTAAARRAIMRELVEGVWEQAAQAVERGRGDASHARCRTQIELAARVRALADAPAG